MYIFYYSKNLIKNKRVTGELNTVWQSINVGSLDNGEQKGSEINNQIISWARIGCRQKMYSASNGI